MGTSVRSLDAIAARADRVALASTGHHSGRHRRCHPHAAAARAHRCSVQRALDRPHARLDRREPRNYRRAPGFTALRYLMMYPFWAFFSLYPVVTLLEISTAGAGARWAPAFICVAAL